MRVKLESPNTVSLLWILICIRISFADNFANTFWFENVIWVSIVLLMIPKFVIDFKFNQEKKSLLYAFVMLLSLMSFGLIFNASFTSIRAIIGVVCVFCFILEVSYSKCEIQPIYIRPWYYIAFTILLIKTIQGVELGNSVPGCIVFLTCAYLVAEYCLADKFRKKNIIISVTLILVVFYISWNSHSRAASLALIIGLLAFFALKRFKKGRSYNILFWFILLGVLALILVYAKISTYSWYDRLNEWSLEYFDKNADSSRGELWRKSLESLKWYEWIIGKGTGTLPSLVQYETASFHSTYVQLLMQNGLLGLLCLIWIFRILWNKLLTHRSDNLVKFVLACFISIMVYNCFECTLLQNKAFLGIVQWSVLGLGIVRCRYLDALEKMEDSDGKAIDLHR